MDGTAMMSRYDVKPAKKVFVYRNGRTDSQPKCMVVNDRQVRDFSTFLNRVTSGLRAPVAIRNIYTPAGGHKVKTLNDLRSGQHYVAGGAEQFKKVKYGSEAKRLLAQRTPKHALVLPPRTFGHGIVASARYKRPVEKPFVIHVFRNGDERYRGARVLLSRRLMGSWERVLELVTEKSSLFTPAKRLCTLDGRLLHAVSELQDGGKYVALEGTKPFQKVSYCAVEEKKSPLRAAATFPRIVPKLKRRHHPRKQTQEGGVSDTSKSTVLTESLKHKTLQRRKSRPFAGRKNKEGREKAVEDHRADSIFGGSPFRTISPAEIKTTSQEPPPPNTTTNQAPKTLDTPVEPPPALAPPPVQTPSPVTQAHLTAVATVDEQRVIEGLESSSPEGEPGLTKPGPSMFHADSKRQESIPATEEYVEDTSGEVVFKAKAPRSESHDAEEVLESGDTEVEKPVELEEALEVAEEVDNDEAANEQAPQVVKELESQPLQTSVDLSLQRNKPQDITSGNSSPITDVHTDTTSEPTATRKSSAASIRSKRSSRKPSKTESRPISVEHVNQSRTHSVLEVSRPQSKAAEQDEKITSSPKHKESVSSNQDEVTNEETVPTSVKSGVDSERAKSENGDASALEQNQQTEEEGPSTTGEVTTTTVQPNTVANEQVDSSVDNKEEEITEELQETGTVNEGDPVETETTFVIEDIQGETQS